MYHGLKVSRYSDASIYRPISIVRSQRLLVVRSQRLLVVRSQRLLVVRSQRLLVVIVKGYWLS